MGIKVKKELITHAQETSKEDVSEEREKSIDKIGYT